MKVPDADDSSERSNPNQQSNNISTTGKLIKYAEIVNSQGFVLPMKVFIFSKESVLGAKLNLISFHLGINQQYDCIHCG